MFSPENPAESESQSKSSTFCAALLFLIWFFHVINNVLYFYDTDVPPVFDCSFHLLTSLNFYEQATELGESGYFGRVLGASGYYPPLVYALTAPFYLAGGVKEDSAVLVNLFFLAVLMWSAFRIGGRLHSISAGFWAAALISFFPFVYGVSRIYYLETGLMAVTTWALWRLLKAYPYESSGECVALGISFGLGMMAKWTFFLFVFFPTVYLSGKAIIDSLGEKGTEKRSAIRLGPFDLGSLIFGLGIGLVALAASDEKPVLWIPPALLAPLIGMALASRSRTLRLRLLNLALSGGIAFLICYPWYSEFLDHVTGVAAGHKGAVDWSLPSLLYYFLALESNQLGPGFFILFLVALLVFPWRRASSFGLVLVWVFSSYLLLTLLPISFKDPRFIAPILPGIGLFMAIAFCSIRFRILRVMILALAVLNGLWQFGMNTYNLPLPSGNKVIYRDIGFIVFWNHGIYGTGEHRGKEWPHRRIAESLSERFTRIGPDEEQPVLRVLMDRPVFHRGVFDWLATKEKRDWTTAFNRVAESSQNEVESILNSEAILFSGQETPDDYYVSTLRKPFSEINRNPHSFLRVRFPTQEVYGLPDGTTVVLAFRREGGTLDAAGKNVFSFGDDVSVRTGALTAKSDGNGVSVILDWEIRNPQQTDQSFPTTLRVELFNLEGQRIVERDFSFMDAGFEEGAYQGVYNIGSVVFEKRPGIYQAAISMLQEESGNPVKVESAGLEDQTRLFLHEVFAFEGKLKPNEGTPDKPLDGILRSHD